MKRKKTLSKKVWCGTYENKDENVHRFALSAIREELLEIERERKKERKREKERERERKREKKR